MILSIMLKYVGIISAMKLSEIIPAPLSGGDFRNFPVMKISNVRMYS